MTRAKHQSKADSDTTTDTSPVDRSARRRRGSGSTAGKKAEDLALARQRARERAARDD
jgi:hypothetical protein